MCVLTEMYFACGHNAGHGPQLNYCQTHDQGQMCRLKCFRIVILGYCEPCMVVLWDASQRLVGYEAVDFAVNGLAEDDSAGDDSEYDSEYDSECDSEHDEGDQSFDDEDDDEGPESYYTVQYGNGSGSSEDDGSFEYEDDSDDADRMEL
jgi:hypothetical protein